MNHMTPSVLEGKSSNILNGVVNNRGASICITGITYMEAFSVCNSRHVVAFGKVSWKIQGIGLATVSMTIINHQILTTLRTIT